LAFSHPVYVGPREKAISSKQVAVRESQGLTLAEVAKRIGSDPPALSRLETGKMLNPTLATLHKSAEALGQRLEVDLSGKGAARDSRGNRS